MSYNQKAPPASAPKGGDYFNLPPYPEDGPVILTIVAYNFVKDHPFKKEDGSTYIADAIEFFLGGHVDDEAHFVKGALGAYSIHEKSNYAKLYKAATGALPIAGCNPDDILGKGVQTILENEDKVSKKGKAYTKTSIRSVTAVKASLRGSVIPREKLLPELTELLDKDAESKPAAGSKAAPGKKTPDEDAPF